MQYTIANVGEIDTEKAMSNVAYGAALSGRGSELAALFMSLATVFLQAK